MPESDNSGQAIRQASNSVTDTERTFTSRTATQLGMNRRTFLTGLGTGAAVATLSGCTGDGGDGSDGDGGTGDGGDGSSGGTTTGGGSGQTETVRMSYVPVSALAPLFLAIEEGYFSERNVEVQLNRLPVDQIYPQLSTGQLDAAHIAMSASMFNSMAQGIEIATVADVVRANPGIPATTGIMIREDHYSEGMTLQDMPDGFTWALITDAGVNEYVVARELQARGMTFDDVELTTMAFPDMIPAMDSGSIDAASIAYPLAGQMAQQTGAKHYRYFSEPAPNVQIAGMIFGSSLRNERPDVARKWLEAYVLGIRRYYELTYYDDRVIGILNDYLEIPEPALKASPPNFHNRNGFQRADSIMRQQEFLACRGHVENPVDRENAVDHSLLEAALDNIGRVDNPNPSPDLYDEWVQNAARPFPPMQEEYDISGFPAESICGSSQ